MRILLFALTLSLGVSGISAAQACCTVIGTPSKYGAIIREDATALTYQATGSYAAGQVLEKMPAAVVLPTVPPPNGEITFVSVIDPPIFGAIPRWEARVAKADGTRILLMGQGSVPPVKARQAVTVVGDWAFVKVEGEGGRAGARMLPIANASYQYKTFRFLKEN